MDPNANLQEQLELARKITALVDTDVPWASSTEFGGDSDKWGDEQSRSEYFEQLSDELGGMGSRLAELVTALDEWRRSGGFDPYKPAEPEPTRERPPGTIRVQFECLTEATLRETWEADIPADTPEDELEDAIWEAQATVGEAGTWEFVDEKNLGEGDRDLVKDSIEIIGGDQRAGLCGDEEE